MKITTIIYKTVEGICESVCHMAMFTNFFFHSKLEVGPFGGFQGLFNNARQLKTYSFLDVKIGLTLKNFNPKSKFKELVKLYKC